MSTFFRVERLIATEGFGLQTAQHRYAPGVWVALCPNPFLLDAIRSADDFGDLDALAIWGWLWQPEWLPVATSEHGFFAALSDLEIRLASIPDPLLRRNDSAWSCAINKALEDLGRASQKGGYGLLEGKLPKIPLTLERVLTTSYGTK